MVPMSTNQVRLRALVQPGFSSDAVTVSLHFVRVQGRGNWNPRMVAVQRPGSSSHFYGTFLDGTNNAPRHFASYYEASRGESTSPPTPPLATATPRRIGVTSP